MVSFCGTSLESDPMSDDLDMRARLLKRAQAAQDLAETLLASGPRGALRGRAREAERLAAEALALTRQPGSATAELRQAEQLIYATEHELALALRMPGSAHRAGSRPPLR
jgi:hypothetical protein